MAKIKLDTSKIEGYDNLPEEVKKSLAEYGIEVPVPDYSGYVTKDIFDKKASEAADLAKQLRERLTEDEKKAADQKALMDELDALKKEKQISSYTTQFMSLGYPEDLAKATAQAKANGDEAVVFENHKKALDFIKKGIEQKIVGGTPNPTNGKPPTGYSNEELDKLSDEEYYKHLSN